MSGKKKGKPGGKKELAAAKARLEAELARFEEEFAAAARSSVAALARADELRLEKESLERALHASEAAHAEAAAERDRLDSHVGQLRAALDDSHRETAQLRERIEAAIAVCAIAELRVEDAIRERDALAAEHASEEALRQAERDRLAGEAERLERELAAWNGTLYARLRRILRAIIPGGLARPRG